MKIIWLDEYTYDVQIDIVIKFVKNVFSAFKNYGNFFEYTITLADYPNINAQELDNIINFILYNLLQKRSIGILCECAATRNRIDWVIKEKIKSFSEGYLRKVYQEQSHKYKHNLIDEYIPKCNQCYEKRCHTKYVSHTTSVNNALMILENGYMGSLNQLKKKGINMERDENAVPSDYRDGIFFVYANCFQPEQDYYVQLPDMMKINDISRFHGVRFYFLHSVLMTDPQYVVDGFHVCRVNDQFPLEPYLKAVVFPKHAKSRIPNNVQDKYGTKILFTDYKKMSCLAYVHYSYQNFIESLKVK